MGATGFFSILSNRITNSMNTMRSGMAGMSNAFSLAATNNANNVASMSSAVQAGTSKLASSTKTAFGTSMNATAGLIGAGFELGANLTAGKVSPQRGPHWILIVEQLWKY